MAETSRTAIVLDEAARMIGVPPPLVARAAACGLAIPERTAPTLAFSPAEIERWRDLSGIGRLLAERLRRDAAGRLLGEWRGSDACSQLSRFTLPFTAVWLVTDGGSARTPDGRIRQTHHDLAPCVRWAWDFAVIDDRDRAKARSGMPRRELLSLRFRRGQAEGEPDYDISEAWEPARRARLHPEAARTRDHLCFEREVVAPADGVILAHRGAYDEAAIDQAVATGDDREFGFLIDHGDGEYSQIAHVLARSLRIRAGDRVRRGQTLCLAGGDHFFPHLHWAVWDSWHPLFAQALPVRIDTCELMEAGAWVRRDALWLEMGMLVRPTAHAFNKR